MRYVVAFGCTFLQDFGQYWTRWVCDVGGARKYDNLYEAELVAHAVEGRVQEVSIEAS